MVLCHKKWVTPLYMTSFYNAPGLFLNKSKLTNFSGSVNDINFLSRSNVLTLGKINVIISGIPAQITLKGTSCQSCPGLLITSGRLFWGQTYFSVSFRSLVRVQAFLVTLDAKVSWWPCSHPYWSLSSIPGQLFCEGQFLKSSKSLSGAACWGCQR